MRACHSGCRCAGQALSPPRHNAECPRLLQGACCFVDLGGRKATSADELGALLAQPPAPGAPANATPALFRFDHVLGGAGGAGVEGTAAGGSGAPQRTAVLYGTPAAPCFGHMLAVLDAAARAGEGRPGARSLTTQSYS